MLRTNRWMVAVAVAITFISLSGAPASAEPAVLDDRATQIASALRLNPGSHQLDANTIQLAPGVQMSLLPSDQVAAASCKYAYLCLFQHGGYGGALLRFFFCRLEYLERYRLPDGRDWRDKTSAFINNQTPGTMTGFMDTVDPNYFYVFYSYAPERVSDLVRVHHPRGNFNERVDKVQVC